jgi:hypothetical protein
MKQLVLTGFLFASALMAPPVTVAQNTAPAAAPMDSLAADIQKDWLAQKTRLLAMAEAMPEEKYSFKPTPEQRSFGEQLAHLADAHVRMLGAIDVAKAVPAPAAGGHDHGASKAGVMKWLTEAYDFGAAVLKANQGALLTVDKSTTRARAFWAAMGNAQNHYGQCVVYLRLNGIVPPASRK